MQHDQLKHRYVQNKYNHACFSCPRLMLSVIKSCENEIEKKKTHQNPLSTVKSLSEKKQEISWWKKKKLDIN